jgi:hypothetical protein
MPMRLRQEVQTLPRGAGRRVALGAVAAEFRSVLALPIQARFGKLTTASILRPFQYFDRKGSRGVVSPVHMLWAAGRSQNYKASDPIAMAPCWAISGFDLYQ